MFNESNCDRKSQLCGILTELLNSRDRRTLFSGIFLSLIQKLIHNIEKDFLQ